jgi:dTDP-4-amino-4,6-dideoxygalactose transaminase
MKKPGFPGTGKHSRPWYQDVHMQYFLLITRTLGTSMIPVAKSSSVPLHGVLTEYAKKSRCPEADTLAEEVLSLPVHPRVTDEDRVCINEVA